MATVIFCTKHEKHDGKYIVIDWYDGYFTFDVLGKGITKAEAENRRDERIQDTDGECDVEIYRMVYNPSNSGKFIEVESF